MSAPARQVTSLTNPLVKAVRALHQRKARDETGQFVAEGLKFIIEALEFDRFPEVLLYGPEAAGHPLLERARKATLAAGGQVIEVTRDILAKVSRRDNPQAVIGVFRQVFARLEDLDPAAATGWVALHRVRDPGNLGTVIRTADAGGCGAVILVGECCDPYSVEAVRATMGSIFALPIVRVDESEFAAWRAGWPGSVVGTLLSATVSHAEAAYRRPTLILLGNEQQGLPPDMAALCDVNVKIPMRGRADSLNLSVAAGVMIYAVTN
ncbi:MAG: RNA methyltransferase [Phenylobacterium sp.]|uniref:TrmH family RNA methyltransferase n=1 Tax=Phenylobacterium sp. TaxID=1871053 RepID=UPI0025F04EB3|nr:RNA methyltransferase [Phenylobacterium sp.]MCA3740510.1 RNA methyltransferase [Phenylobacterium sp.]MCA6247560.1 RNA methyltransferase [Phenylobacterium sp.]MCA6254785.1 RNA methyltransferase [Phenylobacterium sp.]